MEDAPAVRVGDGITDVDKPSQELAQGQCPLPAVAAGHVCLVETADRVLEAVALDEAHGIVGPAVGIRAQPVDRHDPGMLQPAGDLRLQEKARTALRVVGVLALNLLQRHLAVQLLILGDKHFTQAASGMRPQDAITQSRACGLGGRRRSGRVRVIGRPGGGNTTGLGLVPGRRQGGAVRQTGLDLGVRDLLQPCADPFERADGREALLRIAPMQFQVLAHERLEKSPGVLQQRSLARPGSGPAVFLSP